ncbi:hypothetical protein HCH_00610 [Hahella chejuensis KCTC 2396]|uniref:Uncharacterized protein n=1 Tax=Hahella chejuensis (strain KCTC 2396) TaxID=349521 RepID=Q2SPB1_HAHCH|nr:hypothetical protein [Hahella chejuensis]ABC27513.1 hypothetical protein HCH_00610 [Hahella chejuensis KCTC 2396]
MIAESIYTNSDNFTAFPEPGDVFASDFEKSVMLPLAMYRPERFNEEILLATPFGDSEGLVGKEDLNEFIGEEWYSYSKVEDKWKLDCTPEDLSPFEYNFRGTKAETLKSYLETKKKLIEFGSLPKPSKCTSPGGNYPLFIPKEEISSGSNWFASLSKRVPFRLLDQTSEYSSKLAIFYDGSGNAYQYLGYLYSDVYTRCLNPQLHFLYCAPTRRVLVGLEFY